MVVDLFLVYQFIKRLSTPFDKWKAFELGIIDKDGNILKSRSDFTTRDEKDSFGVFDNMVLKIKKLLNKVPGGESKIGTYTAALWLLKEYHHKELTSITEDSLVSLYEEAAANCVGTGNVASVGIGPQGEPPGKKGKVMKRNGSIIKSITTNNPIK